MAVSGSIDFALTGEEIVREARSALGIDASEEALQAHELQDGLRRLNMMLKAWQADGVKYWTMTEGTLTLVESQSSYSFGSGGDFATVPFDMMDIRITRSATDLQMTEISRDDYNALPNKSSEGYPTLWFYDRQRDSGTLYVWPTPDATAGTLKFTYRRTLQDIDSGPQNMDLPQEWYEAVVYNLAKRLAAHYGPIEPTTLALVNEVAATSYVTVKDFDVSEGAGSVMITPDRRYG